MQEQGGELDVFQELARAAAGVVVVGVPEAVQGGGDLIVELPEVVEAGEPG